MPIMLSSAGRSARRTSTALTLVGAVLVLLLTVYLVDPASAADPAVARGRLVRLEISRVPALGLTAFDGAHGKADTPPPESEDPGDYTDPDGVLGYVTIGAGTVRTARSSAKLYAQAHISGIEVKLNGRALVKAEPRPQAPGGGSAGAVDTYAECTPAPYLVTAFAYARVDGGTITVLGHLVPIGTTTVGFTGSDIGRTGIGASTLTVTVAPYQRPDSGSPVVGAKAARAGVDVTVTGTVNDTHGTRLYRGPVTALQLGHVEVVCDPAVIPPTPTPTNTEEDPTPPPPPTSWPPTTWPPTSHPPTSWPPTSQPPTSWPPTSQPPTSRPPTSPPPTSTSSKPPASGSPVPPVTGNPPPDTGRPVPPRPRPRPLPGTGMPSMPLMLSAAAGFLGIGTVLVLAVRRRDDRD
ncbi:hypothetical protein [Yinghuangia seranimata]|uniref:hypothetical protein n=1 Tax=Yinghuangia seranimata TaxID=408067 RepID=UPI00248CB73D|nr:hypothetical protein [Yinghuangia seranimata]MDI2125987.1 hypothetical protein [Yinghuangia seranimata]